MATGDQPLFNLWITDRENTKNRTLAGVAFEADFGQLAIKLNPGIMIDWKDPVFLTLKTYVPPGKHPKAAATSRTKEAQKIAAGFKADNDPK